MSNYIKIQENNANSPKSNNFTCTNSPSFGCTRPKSVDDIISINSSSIEHNKNENKKKITCYKKPRHYIQNKSMDCAKNKNKNRENNRYINNNYDINNNSNYNTYNNSKLISPIYSSKKDKYLQK